MKVMVMTACVLMMVTGSWAAAQPGNPSETPEYKRLAAMVGRRQVVMEVLDASGDWQVMPGRQISTIEPYKNGYLRERIETPDAKTKFNLELCYGYNQFDKFYQLTVMDDFSGLIDVYHGNMDGDTLVLDNLRAGTRSPNSENTLIHYKVELSGFATDGPRMRVYGSTDGGKSWAPMMRVTYARLGE